MPRLEPGGNVGWIREHVATIVGVVLFGSTVVVAAKVFPRLLNASAHGSEAASGLLKPAAPLPVAAPASR